MERRSVSDLIAKLEPLLRKLEHDDALAITHAEEEAACKVGDNYMSVVMQTTVKGLRGNGTSYSKSLMTKYLPSHREVTSMFRTVDLFHNESYFYNKLLPLLGNFGPVCLHTDPDSIIMEDLRPLGFSVLERLELLDLEHSLATVQTLARLHASSLILKFKDPSGFLKLMEPLKEVLFACGSGPTLGTTVENTVKIAIKHLEWIQPRSKEIEEGIEYLKTHEGKVYTEMQDLVEPGRGKFDVLTHGDCWNNNIMFRHDPEGKVLDVKLLDFQISRHVSPAIDFHYFVYSSPKSVVIEANYEDLVEAYHSKFVETLREDPGFPREAMSQLTMKWFKNELKTHAKYGLFTGCWIARAVLAEDEDVLDLDNLTLKEIQEIMSKEVKIAPKIAERLKCIVLDYMRRYV